jgi:outer membrane lipoprotein SlyB
MMRMKITAPLVSGLLAMLLAGCAGNPRPIVDMRGVDPDAYQADLAECEALAREVNVAGGAVRGAAGGAAVGGAVGAVRRGGNVSESAGVGAIYGGASSASANERERQRVARNCLRSRGYTVLN